MRTETSQIRDCLRLSSIFVYESETLFNALEAFKKYKVESVTIVGKDFSVIGFVDKKAIIEIIISNPQNSIGILKSLSVDVALKKSESPIVLYPRMTVIDAYTTMKYLNVKCLPVVDVPWEKKIIGFLWIEDILPLIEDNNKRVSV